MTVNWWLVKVVSVGYDIDKYFVLKATNEQEAIEKAKRYEGGKKVFKYYAERLSEISFDGPVWYLG